MTFAKSLGASSDQFSIQVPQGDDTKDDEKKGDAPKMEDDKGKGGDEDKDKKQSSLFEPFSCLKHEQPLVNFKE